EMEQKQLNLAEGYKSGFTEGHESGFTEGHESGFTEGANNKALEMARKMKEDGIPMETIVKYSGLDKTAISGL
ncbi:MAG: hypothetical protein ACI4TL_03160, partial [Candidatus Cryptobacteroides sp.]